VDESMECEALSKPGSVFVANDRASKRRITGRQRWILGALLAQTLLISAYIAIATSDQPSALIVAAFVLLLVFSGTYVLLIGRLIEAPALQRVSAIALLFVLTIPQFLVLGTGAYALWIFVAVAGGALLAPLAAICLGIALGVAMLGVDAVAGNPLNWSLALTLVALTAFMVGFANNIRLNIELRRTREQLAVTAVAAERERIGRDLHDILGHSLTAIAVKAGLARRLIERDPQAAAVEIGDVERLARDALKDVRATASGYREVSLAAELAVAGAVLRAAGIAAALPSTVDDVEADAREVFGYVVREAVTNVVRHSGAHSCRVSLDHRSIEIADDGTGLDSIELHQPGTGLRNLADRLAVLGGTFEAGPDPDRGFVVRATVPVLIVNPVVNPAVNPVVNPVVSSQLS
jgi:two-component system sensor histidine kinase DesK